MASLGHVAIGTAAPRVIDAIGADEVVLRALRAKGHPVANRSALPSVRDRGRTYVRATGQPRFRIYPTSTSRFEPHAVTAAVEFVTSPEGVVTSLVLHQNGAKVARKVQ